MQRRPEVARIRATLAKSAHFRELAPAQLDRLAELSELRRLRNGALAGAMAKPVKELWIVVSGGLRLGGVTPDGDEFLYAVLGPGSFYGLGNIILGSVSIAEARAHGATELAALEGGRLLALLDAEPRLWRHFCRLLVHRLTVAMSVIRDLNLAPLRQRIAQRLLGQVLAGASDGTGLAPSELRLTQSELGRMLGSSRSKINAELKALEQEGLLRLSYRSIALLDPGRLRSIAGPDVFAF